MRIVLVDDSKTQLHIVTTILKELGYTDIVTCESFEDARKRFDDGMAADLIISDWHMPGGSGLDLLKHIRAVTSTKGITFIMCTSEREKSNIIEAVKVGIQGYLFKPIDKNTLKNKLYDLSKSYSIQPPAAA